MNDALVENKVRLFLGDWQYNIGIAGVYNILRYSGDPVTIEADYLEFEVDSLENFEEKYFNYLIARYGKLTHWEDLKWLLSELNRQVDSDCESLDKDKLKKINDTVTALKAHLKKPNYGKVYTLIDPNIDILKEEKKLSTVKMNKGQSYTDLKDEIKSLLEMIERIHSYVFSDKGVKYLFAKNLIYNIVQNSWNNVSFLNKTPKDFDIYKDFKENFVDKLIAYIQEDKTKHKLECFITGLPIKSWTGASDLSFINDTGFDVNRKPSHIWGYNNDMPISELARFVYVCMPCGLTYSTFGQAIFINANQQMQNLIDVNGNIRVHIEKDTPEGGNRYKTYKALLTSIEEQSLEKGGNYELADVQMIRMLADENNNMKYRFNILSKNALQILHGSHEKLESLMKCGFSEGKQYYSLYPLVIDHILNGVNMFNLIHKLLVYKIGGGMNVNPFYGAGHIANINMINNNFMEGVGTMNQLNASAEVISRAQKNGYHLGENYKQKEATNKVNGIVFRLLNALKTRNEEMFLHILLTCYMYINKPVPKDMEQILVDEETFSKIGYAFVTGLVSSVGKESDKKENEGGKANE